MKNITKYALLLAVGASWLMAVLYFPELPERIPIHWNLSGEIDRWEEKHWAFLFPVIVSATALMVVVLPAISPAGFRLDEARYALKKITLWIVLFFLAVQWLSLHAALHPQLDFARWLLVACGVLLVAMGNLLGKFPKNFFVGIRTPWTLASDRVWDKTHRLAQMTFVLAGGVLVAMAACDCIKAWALAVVFVLAALVPVVYSYVVYRRQEGFSSDKGR